MSAKFHIYSSNANPSVDAPLYYLSGLKANLLLDSGRGTLIGRRFIRLCPRHDELRVDPKIVQAAGYDHAVDLNHVRNFCEVYEMRNSGGIDMWQYAANSRRATA